MQGSRILLLWLMFLLPSCREEMIKPVRDPCTGQRIPAIVIWDHAPLYSSKDSQREIAHTRLFDTFYIGVADSATKRVQLVSWEDGEKVRGWIESTHVLGHESEYFSADSPYPKDTHAEKVLLRENLLALKKEDYTFRLMVPSLEFDPASQETSNALYGSPGGLTDGVSIPLIPLYIWGIHSNSSETWYLVGVDRILRNPSEPAAVLLGWLPAERLYDWSDRAAIEWDYSDLDSRDMDGLASEPSSVDWSNLQLGNVGDRRYRYPVFGDADTTVGPIDHSESELDLALERYSFGVGAIGGSKVNLRSLILGTENTLSKLVEQQLGVDTLRALSKGESTFVKGLKDDAESRGMVSLYRVHRDDLDSAIKLIDPLIVALEAPSKLVELEEQLLESLKRLRVEPDPEDTYGILFKKATNGMQISCKLSEKTLGEIVAMRHGEFAQQIGNLGEKYEKLKLILDRQCAQSSRSKTSELSLPPIHWVPIEALP